MFTTGLLFKRPAKILGTEGLSDDDIQREVKQGAKFVRFYYNIGLLATFFYRGSDVYFIRAGEKTLARSWRYSLLTLVTGWWSIPRGPFLAITALGTNMTGGENVTARVLKPKASPKPSATPTAQFEGEPQPPIPDPMTRKVEKR